MALGIVNSQAISATGTQFVSTTLSAGGVSGEVPYSILTDGNTLSGTGAFQLYGSLPPIAISGTALVSVTNQLDASVHGFVSAHITNTVRVDLSATADVRISHQLDASVHGQVSAFITNTPRVIASNETSSLYDGTTALTPKFANVSMKTAGAQTIIAAVAAKKLRILSMMLVNQGALTLYATDAGGGNNLLGDSTNQIALAANSGFVMGFNPVGWLQTSASSAFAIVPSLATSIAGTITYVEV